MVSSVQFFRFELTIHYAWDCKCDLKLWEMFSVVCVLIFVAPALFDWCFGCMCDIREWLQFLGVVKQAIFHVIQLNERGHIFRWPTLCYIAAFLSSTGIFVLFTTNSVPMHFIATPCFNQSFFRANYLYITIKSTSSYHTERLGILLKTWIPYALALRTANGLPVVAGVSLLTSWLSHCCCDLMTSPHRWESWRTAIFRIPMVILCWRLHFSFSLLSCNLLKTVMHINVNCDIYIIIIPKLMILSNCSPS